MDQETFENYLQNRFNKTLFRIKRLESRNEKSYQVIQWSIIIFSLLTSVLIGIEQFFNNTPLKVAALITSVMVASLASLQKTFNYQDRSAYYRKMLTDLEREFYLFQANVENYSNSKDKEKIFISTVENIIMHGVHDRPHYRCRRRWII